MLVFLTWLRHMRSGILEDNENVNLVWSIFYRFLEWNSPELIASHKTVSGRFNTQNRDRNLAGTEAPLPNGKYSVAKHYIAGNNPEVGGRFLSLSPRFSTGRSALGIHSLLATVLIAGSTLPVAAQVGPKLGYTDYASRPRTTNYENPISLLKWTNWVFIS
jgi:hypothetical protein